MFPQLYDFCLIKMLINSIIIILFDGIFKGMSSWNVSWRANTLKTICLVWTKLSDLISLAEHLKKIHNVVKPLFPSKTGCSLYKSDVTLEVC